MPHDMEIITNILFQVGCRGNYKSAKYSHSFYNFLLDMSYFFSLVCQVEGFKMSHPLMIFSKGFV